MVMVPALVMMVMGGDGGIVVLRWWLVLQWGDGDVASDGDWLCKGVIVVVMMDG